MSTRLESLQFQPNGPSGWGSPLLEFGQILTLVLGPNGTGKTPLLKGLVFALGHTVELPPDVRQRCSAVTVTLSTANGTLRIQRQIGDGFTCRVIDTDGSEIVFSEEKGFTACLLARLNIPERHLADKGTGIVPPFMSVLVPMFWIDQDLGWRNLYSPLAHRNFVKDQAEEVVRWLLGIPPKNRPVDKSDFARSKQKLESINEQIAIKRSTLSALRSEVGADPNPGARETVLAERDAALAGLKTHSSVLEVLAKSHSSLDVQLRTAQEERDSAQFAADAARRRLADLTRLEQELTAEVEILETNEIAADAFRSLCGNENCQFFRKPEESYGRRLLYLKDQLKDFRMSFSMLEQEAERLHGVLVEKESRFEALLQEKKSAVSETPEGNLVVAVDALTRQLSEAGLRLARLDNIAKEEERLATLINRALKAEEEVNELRPTRGSRGDQAAVTDARVELGRSFEEWLRALRTQNLPNRVSFDENLRLFLGEERFTEASSFSGSTRTRIVLAYHAALVETSYKLGGCHPGFLILDTPKQHELHAADLTAFVERFRSISMNHRPPTQLVIGATEQDFVASGLADAVWRPSFPTSTGRRFLGPPGEAST